MLLFSYNDLLKPEKSKIDSFSVHLWEESFLNPTNNETRKIIGSTKVAETFHCHIL